jgi:hypothetical protein
MRVFRVFSIFRKRARGPFGVLSPSAIHPGPSSAPRLLANIVYSALALTLFYFLSRPAFK